MTGEKNGIEEVLARFEQHVMEPVEIIHEDGEVRDGKIILQDERPAIDYPIVDTIIDRILDRQSPIKEINVVEGDNRIPIYNNERDIQIYLNGR